MGRWPCKHLASTPSTPHSSKQASRTPSCHLPVCLQHKRQVRSQAVVVDARVKQVRRKLISRNTGNAADASAPRKCAQNTTAACTEVVHVHKGMVHTHRHPHRTQRHGHRPRTVTHTALYTMAYTLAASLASGATAATWPAAGPSSS